MRFVSTKRRRRDQWKLRIRPCLKGPVFYSSRTSQDKTSNTESFDRESVTSCRISGCLSDAAKKIADSPLMQSVIVGGGGLANLSCPCDHCVNSENEPDKNIERQGTSPSELILF